jgi:hypothetical protein
MINIHGNPTIPATVALLLLGAAASAQTLHKPIFVSPAQLPERCGGQ